MYTIQANPSGTRSIEVSNENLRTIEKYALFRHLIDSTGIVDEAVLDKLKLNIRSLIASQEEDSKDLLDLCIDVIYHNNMKAFGLQQLIKLSAAMWVLAKQKWRFAPPSSPPCQGVRWRFSVRPPFWPSSTPPRSATASAPGR